MDVPILMRRPLPKHGENEEHKEKLPYKQRKNVKIAQAKESFTESLTDKVNLSGVKKEKKKVYYYIKLNGPSLFPCRQPKTLPKIKRGGKVDANLIIDQTLTIPSLNQEINNNFYFLDINDANLKDPVGDLRKENSSVQKYHYQNLNDNDLVPEFIRVKPWRLQLLEQQKKQINKQDVYDDIRQDASEECFITQPSSYLEQNEIEMKRKCNRRVVLNETEDIGDEMLPEVNSFKVNKSVVRLTDGQLQSLLNEDDTTSDEDGDIEANFFTKNGNVISRDASKLNLKGFFMDALPIISQLCACLTSVDLSFNDFKIMPEQLFMLTNVTSLNMRNNPLSSIPKGIKQMKKLKHLNLSFCLLTKVSKNICTLHDLQVLDVSYNLITSVHENICKLVLLKELFVDGNMISIFPRSILKLNLKSLYLKFNFTHKIFWKETCPPVPQKLFDISMMVLHKNNLFHKVPDHLQVDNISRFQCAYCDGIMVGPGIAVLKPVAEIFGVKDLPLLFYVCSQTCRVELQHTEDPPSPI